MMIIDSQVHAYEANTPKRPWRSVPNWPDHVTGDEMVAAMDRVGVDGAIFISAFSLYGYDASYAAEVQRAHPGRFAIIKPVDPDDLAVHDVIAEWKKTPGAVAVRIMDRNCIVTENEWSGTHLGTYLGLRPTGKRVRVRALVVWHFKKNKLLGETVFFDMGSIQKQIGARVSTPNRRKRLSGNRNG